MNAHANQSQIDVTEHDVAAACRYAMVIEWSEEDAVFVVSVPDLPGLHTHGATREEAAVMGDEVIALWIAGARATGRPVPSPRFSALNADNQGDVDAQRIRTVRQRLNASQSDFAEMLNVSVGTVRSWEQGLRTPDGASRRLLDIAERKPDLLLQFHAEAVTGRGD
jgi:DNA-binding transcriptional regulator YiaG